MPLRVRHHALTILAGVSAALLLAVLIAWVVGQWRADRFSLEEGPGAGAARFYACDQQVAVLFLDVSSLLSPAGGVSRIAWSHKKYPEATRAREASMYDRNDFLFGLYVEPSFILSATEWEFAGISFRCDRMHKADGRMLRQLVYVAIPHWLLATLCLPLPLLWFRRYLRLRRQRRLGLCPKCNYDLRGTPAHTAAHAPGAAPEPNAAAAEHATASPTKTCPECGWKGPLPA